MSVIQINIVVLVTLFCFVNLVSCDSYSWGEWRTYKGCQQTGIFSGWRVDMRACYRLDDSDVRHEERDSRKCSQMTDKFRVVDCQDGSNYYMKKDYNVTKQFQYPSGTPGSKHGTPFKFTVPTDGCYKISATGAGGYFGPYYSSGATATGVFKLNSGLELSIVVGKHGNYGDRGAGGGTFVFTVTKDNKRGDLYVVGGGAGWKSCNEGEINCQYNGQDNENGGGEYGGRNGRGGGCEPGYSCSGSGAGWLSSGCGDDRCVYNGKSFEGEFVGGHGGGYGGGGDNGGGGYSGGYYPGGGGSFVNSIASHSNKHKNLPTSTRQHGTASVELVDDNQC